MILDFKNKQSDLVINKLLKNGFLVVKERNNYTLLNKAKLAEAQTLIDNIQTEIPTLSPRQFKYLLAITGLDIAMRDVLEQLRLIDIETYARCKSQLTGASYFEWDKSETLYTQLKPMILNINPDLDLSIEELREKWMICYAS